MNAVISGQAGVALLLDGEKVSSLRAGRPGEVVRRSPNELPLLFGDAKDLQFLEVATIEEVGRRLELASDAVDALHLALILLDESLSHDTRRSAAEELEELLESEENHRFVENILHAHPLPRGADLAGARSICPGNASFTRKLLERLRSLQGVIADVYFAWEQIPGDLFEGKSDKAYAQSVAVREGFFLDLVALLAAELTTDSFLKVALLNEPFRGIRNQREILHAWLTLLRLNRAVEPQRDEVNLRATTVAENHSITAKTLKQGEVLMREREHRKLSLEKLAERLDMSVDHYREIESGNSPAEKWGPLIRDLAVALEVPTSRMFASSGKWSDTRPGQAAELIRKHRETKGLSAEAVAKKLGITAEEYKEIESGSSAIEEWGPFFMRFAAEVLDPHFPGMVFNLLRPFGLPQASWKNR